MKNIKPTNTHDHPGQDLRGNTFWEFKDALNAGRFRRIVKFDPKTHFADVQVTRTFPIQSYCS